MKLTRWMTLLVVTGTMAAAPLFAQNAQSMPDQSTGMTGGQDKPLANQQASADAVRTLQQSLNDKGYDAGKVDGLMGAKTEAALREFQQAEGMQASGEINAETLTALDIDESEFAAFGIEKESAGQDQPGAAQEQPPSGTMEQGGSTMQNGGAADQGRAPDAGTR